VLEALHAHDIVCGLSSSDEGFDGGLFDPGGIEPATTQVLACGTHDWFANVDPAYLVATLTKPRHQVAGSAPDIDYASLPKSSSDQIAERVGTEIRALRSGKRNLLPFQI
jgi:hypothetical protein